MNQHVRMMSLVLALALSFSSAAAATPDDSLTQRGHQIGQLMGSWKGTGTLMGSAAIFTMQWEWVLGKEFLRLTFQNRMSREKGDDRVLNAHAYYQPRGVDTLTGTWYDSRGMVLPLTATMENSTLTTRWGSAETEQGRTVYQINDSNSVTVRDYVLKDTTWHPFGYAVYERE